MLPVRSRVKVAGHNRSMSAESLAVDPVEAAQRLLGAVLTGRGASAVIVEVEAYGGPADGPWPDAASHSFRGLGGRNAVMFGPAGRLYTYLSHGIHVCANVVCAFDGVAGAVLLRAAAIRDGDGRRAVASWAVTAHLCARARPGQPVPGAWNHDGGQRNRPLRRSTARSRSRYASGEARGAARASG